MSRSKIPWVLREDDYRPVLSDQQVRQLSKQFSLPKDILDAMSNTLTLALQRSSGPRSILKPAGVEARGRKALEAAINELRRAGRLVETAKGRLLPVDFASPIVVGSELATVGDLLRKLDQAIQNLEAVDAGYAALLAKGKVPFIRGPGDSRYQHDVRRGMVCGVIIRHWLMAGRPASYTTDPVTSERSGELIDFVNAVVACVTSPPTAISGETIRREIEAAKRLLGAERPAT